MRFAGLQSVSLIDYPGVICSIAFTQGCPFRCAYCHNPDLIPHDREAGLSDADVLQKLASNRLIEGVCVTGGEPTIHPDLPEFLRSCKRLGLLVKLDTNGVNPRMVEHVIRDRSVDFFAMDLKHRWERYEDVIRTGNPAVVENCRRTFGLIRDSGVAHEFRTTVYPGFHSEDDLVAMAEDLKPGDRYALQEIRYGATLDADLERLPPLDLRRVAERIRSKHPDVEVDVRF